MSILLPQRREVSLGAFHATYVLIYLVTFFRSAFNDFGPKFTCVDPTGEQPLTGMIVSIDKVYFLSFVTVSYTN